MATILNISCVIKYENDDIESVSKNLLKKLGEKNRKLDVITGSSYRKRSKRAGLLPTDLLQIHNVGRL